MRRKLEDITAEALEMSAESRAALAKRLLDRDVTRSSGVDDASRKTE